MTVLETKGLSKSYGQGGAAVHALIDANLQIEAGSLTAVLGRSGSGKSTLLHLMGGLDTPTNGTVLLEGVNLYSLSLNKLAAIRRRRIGFVFQDFQLMNEYTACDNILMPLYLDKKSPDKEWLDKLAYELEILDLLNKQPWQLSGGQQQRVAVARALIMRPAVVLADEPTGNLDTESGERVFSLLRQASAGLGQTVVFVTHDMQLANKADIQIRIADGRLIE